MNRTVIGVVDDMFFASKIRAVAEAVGVEISFARSSEALVTKALSTEPQLILVDLHHEKIDPVAVATALKSDERLRTIPVLGFFSHVQVELQRNALAAGFDRVLPRSAFTRDLAQILSGTN